MQKTLKLKDVLAITGVSRSTILRWVDDGQFPPYAVVGNTSLWLAEDIDQWIDEKVAQPIAKRKKAV